MNNPKDILLVSEGDKQLIQRWPPPSGMVQFAGYQGHTSHRM
jgi:hypothetical protein